MSTHTPGPWRYEPGTKTIRSIPANHWLATMNSFDGIPDHEANAALIAAAPELADALEEADRIIRELWAMAQQFNVPDGCHWPELKQSERRSALERAGR